MQETINVSHEWTDEDVEALKGGLRRIADDWQWRPLKGLAKQLTRARPEDPFGWYWLGYACLQCREIEEAERCQRKALHLGGAESAYESEMLQICRCKRDRDGAIKWCRRILTRHPDHLMVSEWLMEAYEAKDQPEKALSAAQQAVNNAPDARRKVMAYNVLVDFHMRRESYDHAAAALRGVLEVDDRLPAHWGQLASCLRMQGKHEEALRASQRAEAVFAPTYDTALLLRTGVGCLDTGEPEEALGRLIKAVQLDPDFAVAHYNLSRAFLELERFQEGAAAARAALRHDPKMLEDETNLGLSATNIQGLCLLYLGELEEAEACFGRAVHEIHRSLCNLGLTFFNMGRYEKAKGALSGNIDMDPTDTKRLDLIAQCCIELGEYAEAERWLRQALEVDPDHALSHYDLGLVFERTKGKRKEAMAEFERAIELDPSFAAPHYAIACLHALAGDKELALQCLAKSLELGYHKKAHIDSDPDMDSLREDARFQTLMDEHFRDEVH